MTAPAPDALPSTGLQPTGLPWHDWQFWVVTIAAIAALIWLIFTMTPAKKLVRRSASGAKRRVPLTVSAPTHHEDKGGTQRAQSKTQRSQS